MWSVPRYEAIALDGHGLFKADRTQDSGRYRGGGLCVCMNNALCSNAVKVEGRGSPDVEFLMLRCRPFYLPREFISVYIVDVYFPTDANSKKCTAGTV